MAGEVFDISEFNQRKSTKEIPEWFSIDNYKLSYDPALWYRWTTERSCLILAFVMRYSKEPEAIDYSDFIAYLSGKGDSPYTNNKPLPQVKGESLIRELDLNDVSLSSELADLNGWPSYNKFTPIAVNCKATDEQIIKEFKSWLAEQREQEGRLEGNKLKPISSREFEKWHEFRVLAYMDLCIWQRITMTEIQDTAIAAALWPDCHGEFNPVDRLRRTTKKLMMPIFGTEGRFRLEAMLA